MFSKYFWNCPVVNVEGRTFPVDTMYLEDVYEMLHYQLPLDSPAALASDPVYIKKACKLFPIHLNTTKQFLTTKFVFLEFICFAASKFNLIVVCTLYVCSSVGSSN